MREITKIARDAEANGEISANLVDNAAPGGNSVDGEDTINTVVNSNRIFINTLAEFENLDCIMNA